MYDSIVIGAGPAGLTASIFLRRSNKKVLVLEANYYGGQIINTPKIENYPAFENISGFDFATKIYNQAKNFGVEIVFERAVEIKNYDDYKEVVTNKKTYQTKTIILATGSDNRHLNIEREKELLGKGVSYCATCDGAFYKGKNVAVIGERNVALEDAIYLSDIASKVYLLARKNNFIADEPLIEKVNKTNNIEVIYNTSIKSLNGENKIDSITIDNDGKESTIEVSGLFVAIGRVPENENFKNIIDVDEKGYIISVEDCHTNVNGIYACGDNRVKGLRQLVTITSAGAIAATEAVKYINKM